MLRWLTAGESHGPALVAMIEGLPAGVEVGAKDLQAALSRRRLGYGRGARMKFEQDEVEFLGGLRHGVTLGSPLAVRIGNSEWPKWTTVMSPEAVSDEAYAASDDVNAEQGGRPQQAADPAAPRPRRPRRHAEVRPRGRPPGARARLRPRDRGPGGPRRGRRPLPRAGLRHPARLAHRRRSARPSVPADADAADPRRRRAARRRPGARLRPRRARPPWSPRSTPRRRTATPSAASSRCSPTACRRASARTSTGTASSTAQLAQALMSIQAIKGVEVGDGFETARRRGSQAHDEMELVDGVITRRTGRAGGTEGGMSTGQVLRVRAAMKPISTVPARARDRRRRRPARPPPRSTSAPTCARCPAAGVVAEAMVALVLAAVVPREVRRRLGHRDVAQPRGIPRRHPRGAAHVVTDCRERPRVPWPSSSARPARARRRSARALAEPARRRRSTTSTPRSRPPRAARSPTSSSTTARPPSATSSAPRWPARSPRSRASSRSAGEPSWTR